MPEVPSVSPLYFPSTYLIQWGYQKQRQHSTIVEEGWGWEQRMPVYPTGGRRRLIGNLEALSGEDRRTVLDYLNTRRGRAFSFYIFEWDATSEVDLLFGTGNGSAVTFTLPFLYDATVTNVKVNGVLQTLTTDYSLGFFTGLERTITFVSAPGNGLPLTANFTGRRRRAVRLDTDTETETFQPGMDTLGIEAISVIEVR